MNRLWMRQILAVIRLELGKNLFSARAIPLVVLAGLPVLGVGFAVAFAKLVDAPSEMGSIPGLTGFFSVIFQFHMRGVVFLGCVWIFMNLFRGEVQDRSLHYYFLAPIRRDLLVAGKFLSGWLISSILFSLGTVFSAFVLFSYRGPGFAAGHLLGGQGFGHLLAYVGVTLLACLGYGALFTVMGLFLRNPIIPAFLIFLWEQINPFLPALLKKLSVLFYLQSMQPVPVDFGPFAMIAEPASAWIAVPGLLVFSAIILGLASLKIRGMEITYGAD